MRLLVLFTRNIHKCFLGAFAKLQKATISFVMSVCLSVRLHGKTLLPLNWFSWKFMVDHFSKICREHSRFINIWQEWRALYLKTNIHLWSYLAEILLEWKMFQKKVVRKIKIHILYSVTVFQEVVPFVKSCAKIWYSQTGQRWRSNMVHVFCVLDN